MKLFELLQLESMGQSTVVAGHQCLDNKFIDISMMEVPDIEDYVKEGDFLLTTMYPIHRDKGRLESIIPTLKNIGLCGVGIKPNRYLSSIPESLLSQAKKLQFPVISIAPEVNFNDVITECLRIRLNRRTAELEHRDRLHDETLRMLMQGFGFDGLAANLSKELSMKVILLSEDGLPVNTHAENGLWAEQVCKKLELHIAGQTINDPLDNNYWYIYPVVHSFTTIGYIVLINIDRKPLNSMERVTVEHYGAVFAVIKQRNISLNEIERRYANEFAYDLLLKESPEPQSAVDRAYTIGWNLIFPVIIIVIQIPLNAQYDYKFRDQLTSILRQEAHIVCGMGARELFIAHIGNNVTLLLNGQGISKLDQIISIAHSTVKKTSSVDCYIGISNPAKDVTTLRASYVEGTKAADIAKLNKSHDPLFFQDTGVYRILYNELIRDDLLALRNDILGPVLRHDAEHKTNYLESLVALIKADGNQKKAAQMLFLHYNTMRYRLCAIGELLNCDHSTLHMRQDISLAISINELFGKNR